MFLVLQFIFCLFQSFERIPPSIASSFTHVVVDECHHLLARTYKDIYYTLMQSECLQYCVGSAALPSELLVPGPVAVGTTDHERLCLHHCLCFSGAA